MLQTLDVRLGKIWCATMLALLALAHAATAQVPSPEAQFGFRMGADRQLASADAIEGYFELVASRSDRVRIVDIGQTTDGHRTIAAIVSAPDNIRNLETIRTINQRLSDPRTLSPDDAHALARTEKAVLAIGGSIHASEVGGTQALCELLFSLATAADEQTLHALDNVVVILIPSLNPDGHRLVVDWYEKQKGTRFEGGPMPWLYHKYAGHDLNRDGFMMNMAENRNLARFFYTAWHPHVFLTMHQMAGNGPRFFVPPNDDPIDPNYDPLIWREAALLGGAMALELERDHHSGVLSNGMYDYYWPGYEDSVPLGHNTVCLLTEAASVKVATPVTVSPSELRAGVKGLPEYKQQINFPDPWPGGSWTLHDIVEYDLSAVRGLLNAVAAYREQLVDNFYEMGRRAVETGRRGGPFAFIIPPEQHDPQATKALEELLLNGGIEIHKAIEPFRADGNPYPAGADIIFLAQPYRAYVKTLLERQRYPSRRLTPAGSPERPYDVAGWTLSQQMGVDVRTIERTFEPPTTTRVTTAAITPAKVWGDSKPGYYIVEGRGNSAAIAVNRLIAAGVPTSWTTTSSDANGFGYGPGSIVVPYSKSSEPVVRGIARDLGLRADGVKGKLSLAVTAISRTRLAVYKPWTENIDEGWTRWVLEQHGFAFTSIADADVRAGSLRSRFDAIVLPSTTADQLINGNSTDAVPSEYAGGLGEIGVEALKKFVEAGGTLICLDDAAKAVISTLNLPVRDVAADAGDRLFCPGSILRLELDPLQPLAYGMTGETAAFFAFGSAYEAAAPRTPTDGHGGEPSAPSFVTIGRYAAKDLLLSGWLEGGEVIAGRPAVVQLGMGTGHVVLIGFSPQHRGQSHATFRLLFNAIFTARTEQPSKR